MNNDDAIVGRIFTRREALVYAAKAGFGLTIVGGAAGTVRASIGQSAASVHLVATPVLTEGPFFVEEKLNRSNLIGDTTRESVTRGIPLDLKFTVYSASGKDFALMSGVHVDVWHTDAHGAYSDESSPMNGENTAHANWLRGYQISDAKGVVQFKTIIPGWYIGRTVHIHFKVRQLAESGRATAEFNSQLFFHDEFLDKAFAVAPYDSRGERHLRNAEDGIFNERQVDGTVAGEHLMLLPEKNPASGGYSAHYAIALTKGNFGTSQHRGPGGPGRHWTPPPGGFGPFDGGTPKSKGGPG